VLPSSFLPVNPTLVLVLIDGLDMPGLSIPFTGSHAEMHGVVVRLSTASPCYRLFLLWAERE
jgi:hypothetical protein